MAGDPIIKALAQLPLLEGLTLAQLQRIARRAERAAYHPGAIIIEENAEGDAAILIISGEAARVSGPELSSRLERVPPGSLLGEAAMLIETIHTSTVVARGHVRTLHIARDELHAQMTEDPALADGLVRNIARRLARLADELREVDTTLASAREDASCPPQPPAPSALLPAPVH